MKGSNRWAVGTVLAMSGSALAGDFNGDGFSDVAVGAWGQNVDGVIDAGAVTILYGSAGGLTGTGSLQITLNTPGVPGVAGNYDHFGTALAIGNFNGDEYADLAVGAPEKGVGGWEVAGEVFIFYGSPQGLTGAGSQEFNHGTGADHFGSALAAGDFNGDGIDDLAIGVPGETVVDGNVVFRNAGEVDILYGSAGGLQTAGCQHWDQNSTDILDKPETDDEFGSSLAVGDFQRDGYDDLAIGVPDEDLTNSDQGAVNVIYGSAAGLTSVGNQFWSQDSPGITGKGEPAEHFGFSLAAGTFGKGGGDDLAVGVPYEDWPPGVKAGGVNMIYGSLASGLRSDGNDLIEQDSTGVPDKNEDGDTFGYVLFAGRIDGDGFDDLVVGCPYEDLPLALQNAGQIIVLGGSTQGIGQGKNFQFNQFSPGIKGQAEANNRFGYSLAVTKGKSNSINGDKFADIVIGIPYKSDACGFIAVIFGSADGPTSAENQLISEDTKKVDGESQGVDLWGWAVGAS